MTDECVELQNIKYQTMLLNSNSKVDSQTINTVNIDFLLEKENNENKKKPWSKLGTSTKIKKIKLFISKYCKENKFKDKERTDLLSYLHKALEKKKLQRTKDVIYDTATGLIKSIPGLSYDKIKKKFTLRKLDRKNSTLKGLGKKRKTKRNKRPNKESLN